MNALPVSSPAAGPTTGSTRLDTVTVLLQAWSAGDPAAFEQLAASLYADFLRMAAGRLRGCDEASLSRGDIVNEALMRLMRSPAGWQNRGHFFATVSLTMRSVLREHARAKMADKRGGERLRLTLSGLELGEESFAADLLTLDALLEELSRLDPRASQVLHLTYFVGLQREEIATVMDLSLRSVDRELRFSRAWLSERLGRDLEA